MKSVVALAVVITLLAAAGCAGMDPAYQRYATANAIGGAAVGACLGAVTTWAFTGRGRYVGQGAAMGAVAGALAGAAMTPQPPYWRPDGCGGYYRSYNPPTPQERIWTSQQNGFMRGREEAVQQQERRAYEQGYYQGRMP